MTTALLLTPATLAACPTCPQPARLLDTFTLSGPDGPVLHAALSCSAGHRHLLPAERLEPLVVPTRVTP